MKEVDLTINETKTKVRRSIGDPTTNLQKTVNVYLKPRTNVCHNPQPSKCSLIAQCCLFSTILLKEWHTETTKAAENMLGGNG